MKNKLVVLAFCLAMVLPASAQSSGGDPPQNPNDTTSTPASPDRSAYPTQNPDEQSNPAIQGEEPQYHYQVNVVQRSTVAVDYRDRGGTTQVDFKGTGLMP